jgi:hypothetical protein
MCLRVATTLEARQLADARGRARSEAGQFEMYRTETKHFLYLKSS